MVPSGLSDIIFRAQQLCQQHRAAGRTPKGVVAEADELVIILGIGPQAAGRYRHTVLQHPVQPGLGTVRLLEIVQELLGGGGQLQLLGPARETSPFMNTAAMWPS